MVTSRLGLSAAVPIVGLLAVVSTAALPDPAATPPPTTVPTTMITVPPATTTTTTTVSPLTSDENATVIQRGDQLEVTLATDVLYEFNSATLAPSAVATLTDLAPKIARSATPGIVAIVGHTDSIGTEVVNQRLSEARAQAVQVVLASARPDLQFEISGRGSQQPVAPNEIAGRDNPDGRALNRRVTITFAAPK